MDFFAEVKLQPKDPENLREEIDTIGLLFLGAAENGKLICSRQFEVEYVVISEGRNKWFQRIMVKDGEEKIFDFQGVVSEREPFEISDTETRLKFSFFSPIMQLCAKQGGFFRGQLVVSDDSLPGASNLLMQLCHGPMH